MPRPKGKAAAAKKKAADKVANKKAAAKEEKEEDDYRSATGVLTSQTFSKDVKITGFTLRAWGKELILDTSIELTIGKRYGLIGSNGSGKSTFLKCLAKREVPIPEHIDIFHLEKEAAPSEMSAFDAVVSIVKDEYQRLEAESERILEEEGPESEVVQGVQRARAWISRRADAAAHAQANTDRASTIRTARTEIYERLEGMDPSTFEVRAGKLLHGLGFSKSFQAKATKDLSGGWRMRVALAQALMIRPTLLLLDEPTNHLDLEACVWLEDYLSKYDKCLVVVSHSQDFLNNVCTNIIHLTNQKRLLYYSGNYDQFVTTKKENEVNQSKQFEKEQEDIKHLKAFIASCGTYSNLVRQAKSKQKIIDKMEAKGLTEAVVQESKWSFKFATCEKLPPPVLAFQNVAFSYSGEVKDQLYQDLSLGVDMDSRIALVGPNGAGKSTLLKLMDGELNPTKGMVRRHINLSLQRYHQHSHEILDPKMSPLEFMAFSFDTKEKREEEATYRSHIGRFGITGGYQTTKIGQLSDGLKTRLIFSMLAWRNPNILLLDEPTNHLDMECIDSLAEAIHKFEGGLVLVSHDFRLIDQVAKEIWVCDNNDVKIWRGDIRSYKKHVATRVL